MQIETINDKITIHQRTFNDALEFREHCQKLGDFNGVRASRESGNDDWYGCSFEQAIKLCENGWKEGVELMKKYTAVFDKIVSEKTLFPMPTPDYHGEYFDIGLAVAGVPECFFRIPEEELPSNGKIVKLGVNLCASASYSGNDLIKRGAAALALMNALELAGKSVDLVVCSATSNGYGNGDLLQYIIPAKKAGELCDIEKIAFLTAHPGAFRRMMFACEENEPASIRKQFGISQGGGYGYPSVPSGKDAKFDILVPELLLGKADDDFIGWILKELTKFGIELK